MKADLANSQSAGWYVLRTYPGVEKKVKRSLENRLRAKNLEPSEYQIVIPAEEEEKTMFVGFVLLKMQLTADLWTLARNTPGVTGFVGMGNKPTLFYTADWKTIPLQRFRN